MCLEDIDCHALVASPPRMFRYGAADVGPAIRVWQAVIDVMAKAGFDPEWGFRLPAAFSAMGLEEIGGEVRAPIFTGGSPGVAAHRFTIERLREPLLASGITEAEIEREIVGLDDPRTLCSMPAVLMAAWGRRTPAARIATSGGAMPSRRETALDRLKNVPLLEACTVEELHRIATLADEVDAPAGAVLTHEGEREATFYIVATGTATVT